MLNTFQQADHPILPKATADEASREEFAKSFKGFIQSTLLPGLTPIYETRVSKAFEKANGRLPENRRDIRSVMIHDLYFQHYAMANRTAQELLWESVNVSIDRKCAVGGELRSSQSPLISSASCMLFRYPTMCGPAAPPCF